MIYFYLLYQEPYKLKFIKVFGASILWISSYTLCEVMVTHDYSWFHPFLNLLTCLHVLDC